MIAEVTLEEAEMVSNYVSAGNGPDLVVGGPGQHTIDLGNGNDILIGGSATVVNEGDSFQQILSDWNSSSSTSVDTRIIVEYNTTHPNVMQAGSGRDWWFYTYSKLQAVSPTRPPWERAHPVPTGAGVPPTPPGCSNPR